MATKSSGLYDDVEIFNIGHGDAGLKGYGDDGIGGSGVTLFVDKEDIPGLINNLKFFYRRPEGFPKWLTT